MTFISKHRIHSRFFNTITDFGDFLEKKSFQKAKLKREYDFFQSLPEHLSSYFPEVNTFIDEKDWSSYRIRKINMHDSSYFFMDKNLYSEEMLTSIIKEVKNYLKKVPTQEMSKDQFEESLCHDLILKNEHRLQEIKQLPLFKELDDLARDNGFDDLEDYCKQINEKIKTVVLSENQSKLYFSHGDMCFSNILYFEGQLYLIDPKGEERPMGNYRLIHYELSKLSQSLLGNYDFINHELFEEVSGEIKFQSTTPTLSPQIRKQFSDFIEEFGSGLKAVRLIEASLFFSLIPFHQESEKKMRGFLLNSFSIFKENS